MGASCEWLPPVPSSPSSSCLRMLFVSVRRICWTIACDASTLSPTRLLNRTYRRTLSSSLSLSPPLFLFLFLFLSLSLSLSGSSHYNAPTLSSTSVPYASIRSLLAADIDRCELVNETCKMRPLIVFTCFFSKPLSISSLFSARPKLTVTQKYWNDLTDQSPYQIRWRFLSVSVCQSSPGTRASLHQHREQRHT